MKEKRRKEYESYLLKNLIVDQDEFLEQYNPWQTERANNLINKFLKITSSIDSKQSKDNKIIYNENDFSWLEIEKDYEYAYLIKKPKMTFYKNIHFGIPNHFHGNISKATIFQCLANPNIALEDKKTSPKDLSEFYEKFKSEHVEDVSSDLSNFKDSNSVKNHLFDLNNSILSKEFNNLINKDKDERINLINNQNNLANGHYYLARYYYPMLIKKAPKTNTFNQFRKAYLNSEKLNTLQDVKEKIDRIKLCNLEVFPFRSQNPQLYSKSEDTPLIGKELISYNNKTTLFSPRIILRRIALSIKHNEENKYKNNFEPDIPIFIFRRYEYVWKDLIRRTLKESYDILNEELIDEILIYLEDNYFYYLKDKYTKSRSGGALLINNINYKAKNIPLREEKRELEEQREFDEHYLKLKKAHKTLIFEEDND
ncbi:hypothetical protein E2558_08540 [Staphylococcus pragensis]|uniref:Uncharacterized protein n=1 Tax=Staphylococcus pragensis TaxID=1611836 RepID=A0A4Z1B1D9_9STAP|nr:MULTISPECIES: hypothetical protein [Staphylococcus]RTX91908.1 hypothetical protein CD154_00860 [Staphylococcus carnosus]TGN27013.1 hypothetical protein E2558_08540 [Staphylococcus pragensis]GGG94581.1 hypothetical protein GCM10007342_17170 [Staphylococcus pragensis]